MNSVRKELCFDAAHRLHQYPGKCAQIHGHRYKVIVELGYVEVSDVGIGIDFGKIKGTVGNWIEENWDHKLILNWNDPLYSVLRTQGGISPEEIFLINGNPTAENMAKLLVEEIIPSNWVHLARQLMSVEVYETPTSSAKYLVKR